MRFVNGIRWRCARWLAPDPIVAAPLGDGQAFVLLRTSEDGEFYAWIEAKTFDLKVDMDIQPLGDAYALANWEPTTKGAFSGTV